LTRKMNVKNKSDKIFEKLSSLDTFRSKNSELGKRILQGDLKENIKSYLEKKSGGKSKKSKKSKKRTKKNKRKNIKY